MYHIPRFFPLRLNQAIIAPLEPSASELGVNQYAKQREQKNGKGKSSSFNQITLAMGTNQRKGNHGWYFWFPDTFPREEHIGKAVQHSVTAAYSS